MEIAEKDRLLFMKYALPCAGTLVRRGQVAQKDVDMLIAIVKNSGKIPKDAEKIFKVAFSACSLIAMDKGKKSIDKSTILEYYQFQHDRMIDKRYSEMGDFDPVKCRIRPGVVESAWNGLAVVSNSLGRKKYRTDFVPQLKKNDMVTTHWDFVVEKIGARTFNKMKKQKEEMKIK